MFFETIQMYGVRDKSLHCQTLKQKSNSFVYSELVTFKSLQCVLKQKKCILGVNLCLYGPHAEMNIAYACY